MTSAVHLGHADAIPLAVVRRRAKRAELATIVPQLCGVVWDFVRARRLHAGRNVAVYLNGDIDLEVGVELASAFEEAGEVIRSHTPLGLSASVTHFGPYHTLRDAHAAIRSWCEAQGLRLAGPNWEIYGHWQPEWNADPSSIRTDVFYQVTRNE